MGVSKATAIENRERVLEVASRLFRERGFDGIGVSDLMKAAGLTHGGFYANFSSKEDLAVQALTRAMEKAVAILSDVVSQSPVRPLTAVVRFYLSERHRDRTGLGCPLAALGSDAARYGADVRSAFTIGLAAHVALIESIVAGSSAEVRRSNARIVMSSMAGALMLSRSVDDDAASKAILADTAQALIGAYERG